MEVPSFSTALTVATKVRAETFIGSVPVATAFQNTYLYQQISDANAWFVNWSYNEGMRGWKWMRKEYEFKSYGQTSCVGAVASGATTFQLTDGTNFDSPSATLGGSYFKNGTSTYDFFTYETKTGTVPATLTGVSGVSLAQTALTEVHKTYIAPTDYGKPRMLALDNVQYMYIDPDYRQIPYAGQFTMKYENDGTYTAAFIVLPYAIGTHDCVFYYFKKPATIANDTDLVDAPDGNGRRALVEKVKQYIWENLGEMDLAQLAEVNAEKAANDCGGQFSTHTLEMNNSLSLMW